MKGLISPVRRVCVIVASAREPEAGPGSHHSRSSQPTFFSRTSAGRHAGRRYGAGPRGLYDRDRGSAPVK